MQQKANVFDIWTIRIREKEPEFLLLRNSQQRADQYFNGSRFWQVPSGIQVKPDSGVEISALLAGTLQLFGLHTEALFYSDFCYTSYSSRRNVIETVSVFAAIVADDAEPTLNDQFDEAGWFSLLECRGKLTWRGHLESFEWITKNIISPEKIRPELRLA